jgi:glycosyltransferase involved in cell wall biosynthesis
MDISVIICTYNRCESLQRVLNNIKELNLPENASCEVIVVDNNSKDDTKVAVEAASAERPGFFKYVFEPRPGKSFALNRGIGLAKGEIIAFTDDDVALDSEWLVEIKRAFERYDCMGVGGRIIPVWDSAKPWWYEDHGTYALMSAIVRLDLGDEPCELHIPVPGANLAYRRAVFEKYGLFREDLGRNPENMVGWEDSEFCLRLIRGSEKFMYAPKAIVYHPVEEKRTKKEYFQSWYFGEGRASVRANGVSEEATCYFGIPRHLIRAFLENLTYWTFSLEPKRRFYHKLQLYLIAGQIVESRKYAP